MHIMPIIKDNPIIIVKIMKNIRQSIRKTTIGNNNNVHKRLTINTIIKSTENIITINYTVKCTIEHENISLNKRTICAMQQNSCDYNTVSLIH